jgi:hypothetical protein
MITYQTTFIKTTIKLFVTKHTMHIFLTCIMNKNWTEKKSLIFQFRISNPHSNESSSSIKDDGYLDLLSNFQILKDDVPYN